MQVEPSLVGQGPLGYGAPGPPGRESARPPAGRTGRVPEPMDDRSPVAALGDAELGRRIAGAPDGAARAEERELYLRFARRVRLYGLRHLGDEDAAADLVQQVMLVTLRKLRDGEVRDLDRLGSFVLGVARMVTRERFRGARREAPLTDAHREMPDAPAPRPDAFAGDRLAACLEALSERERTVVVLTYYGERTSTEIAGALGIRTGNVRVIRHRALGRLRTCLGLDEEDVP